jgi:hypothetical protein
MLRLLKVLFLLAVTSCFLFADFGDNVYFTYQIGSAIPGSQTYSITSQTPNVQLTNVTVHTTGRTWLLASVSNTVTPLTLSIGIYPVGLAPGSYSATVEVRCACTNVIDFDVYLTVVAPLSASPSSLTFNAVPGSSPPASQSVLVGSSLPSGTRIRALLQERRLKLVWQPRERSLAGIVNEKHAAA